MNFYVDDPANTDKIKEVQTDASVNRGEGLSKADKEAFINREAFMDKKEIIATQKILHELSIEQIKELKKLKESDSDLTRKFETLQKKYDQECLTMKEAQSKEAEINAERVNEMEDFSNRRFG